MLLGKLVGRCGGVVSRKVDRLVGRYGRLVAWLIGLVGNRSACLHEQQQYTDLWENQEGLVGCRYDSLADGLVGR